MPGKKTFVLPFILPILAFAAAILVGGSLLSMDAFSTQTVSPVDAFFIATSSVCVTGLSPLDVFTVFNRGGQWVVLVLMQLGGLGIITYTTLIFYLLGKRISLRDRLAVEQGLFYNPEFNLGAFVTRVVAVVFIIELIAFTCIIAQYGQKISAFDALFLCVSAFCNAGFAPWSDSLEQWSGQWGLNSIVMALIVLGGLGFFVLDDMLRKVPPCIRKLLAKFRKTAPVPIVPIPRLSFYSRVVLRTTVCLLLGGALCIFIVESFNTRFADMQAHELLFMSLFESVTSRTAGFASVDQAAFSDITLLLVMFLMFVGGSPGSCAGGIKTTTLRILASSLFSKLQGREQVVVSRRAIDAVAVNKAMLLFYCAVLLISLATFLLVLTENGIVQHGEARIPFFDLFFEVISAFGTVGLSINVTPKLSEEGKILLCVVMFIGKLGPVWLITAVQHFQPNFAYKYPETTIPVG